MTLQLLLSLLGATAAEVSRLTTGGVQQDAVLSQDLITAINATLQNHSSLTGKPIADVLATL